MKRTKHEGGERITAAAIRAIDIWTAILLLTGQLTVAGLFVSSGAIAFSLFGSIFGGVRSQGKSPAANTLIDGIDVITAFLLILGQLTAIGPWITSGRFNLVVSGPVFGFTGVPVPIDSSKISKKAEVFCCDFAEEIMIREMKKRSTISERPS